MAASPATSEPQPVFHPRELNPSIPSYTRDHLKYSIGAINIDRFGRSKDRQESNLPTEFARQALQDVAIAGVNEIYARETTEDKTKLADKWLRAYQQGANYQGSLDEKIKEYLKNSSLTDQDQVNAFLMGLQAKNLLCSNLGLLNIFSKTSGLELDNLTIQTATSLRDALIQAEKAYGSANPRFNQRSHFIEQSLAYLGINIPDAWGHLLSGIKSDSRIAYQLHIAFQKTPSLNDNVKKAETDLSAEFLKALEENGLLPKNAVEPTGDQEEKKRAFVRLKAAESGMIHGIRERLFTMGKDGQPIDLAKVDWQNNFGNVRDSQDMTLLATDAYFIQQTPEGQKVYLAGQLLRTLVSPKDAKYQGPTAIIARLNTLESGSKLGESVAKACVNALAKNESLQPTDALVQDIDAKLKEASLNLSLRQAIEARLQMTQTTHAADTLAAQTARAAIQEAAPQTTPSEPTSQQPEEIAPPPFKLPEGISAEQFGTLLTRLTKEAGVPSTEEEKLRAKLKELTTNQ